MFFGPEAAVCFFHEGAVPLLALQEQPEQQEQQEEHIPQSGLPQSPPMTPPPEHPHEEHVSVDFVQGMPNGLLLQDFPAYFHIPDIDLG